MKGFLALLIVGALATGGCAGTSADYDPKEIEGKYGLSGGYVDEIDMEAGKVKVTVIPTTLDDGREVQLIVPHQPVGDHSVYMRDGITITPMEVSDTKVSKQEFVQSRPRVASQPVAPAPAPSSAQASGKKRSLEKEVLIVGGSAGAGALIGAAAGGKKGASVGALSGGVAGLVYDLATRNKKAGSKDSGSN